MHAQVRPAVYTPLACVVVVVLALGFGRLRFTVQRSSLRRTARQRKHLHEHPEEVPAFRRKQIVILSCIALLGLVVVAFGQGPGGHRGRAGRRGVSTRPGLQ